MISGIKIYTADGVLKEEIPQEQAVKLYNEQNKTNWELSSAERKFWKGYKVAEPRGEYQKTGLRTWIKKKYKKRKAIHKIICKICNKEAIMMNAEALYCGSKCAGVSRRANARKQYADTK